MRNAIQDSQLSSAQLHRRCRANEPRNNRFSKCEMPFRIRGICLPNCTNGAGPMHHATIALANAKRHSRFAAFVCPTAPTVQGQCTTQRSLQQMRNAIQNSRLLSAELHQPLSVYCFRQLRVPVEVQGFSQLVKKKSTFSEKYCLPECKHSASP
jgi:hypothetical protein